jgi:serine/threonine-protein kinase
MATPALENGRYELLGELASGGMATVYLARMRRQSMAFSRLVAIKCMHPQFSKDPSFVSMFLDEARLTARLRHPNVVPTLDIVAEDGQLLLVMEYIEGPSLAMLLRAGKAKATRIPPAIACAIVHDLLLGLHAAHDGAPLAIIHRDVSPQNVLVGHDGLARVHDFGVAKARQNKHQSVETEIKGKIPYMPPEQLYGERIDHRVDVYAAGVTLWETLVGQRLFDGPDEAAIVMKITSEPVPRPSSRVVDLPPAVDAIVMRALSREARERYPSALAMAEALAGAVRLPTRTEIADWVRGFVPAKATTGRAVLLGEDGEPVTTTARSVMSVLARASTVVAARPSLPGPSQAPPIALPAPERTARMPSIPPPRDVAAVHPPIPQPRRSAHRARPAQPRGTRAAMVFAAVGVAVASLAILRVATTEAAPSRGAPVVVRAPEVAAPGCRTPYTVDRQGQTHWKPECVR